MPNVAPPDPLFDTSQLTPAHRCYFRNWGLSSLYLTELPAREEHAAEALHRGNILTAMATKRHRARNFPQLIRTWGQS